MLACQEGTYRSPQVTFDQRNGSGRDMETEGDIRTPAVASRATVKSICTAVGMK
jgi:hypothetical protein